MPSGSFMTFLLFWACVLLFFMAVGGYFMFRKFLKVLPMAEASRSSIGKTITSKRRAICGRTTQNRFSTSSSRPCPARFAISRAIRSPRKSDKSPWNAVWTGLPRNFASKGTFWRLPGAITKVWSDSWKKAESITENSNICWNNRSKVSEPC